MKKLTIPRVAGELFPLPPEGERSFIVTNPHGWGKGKTIREALQKCRRNNPRRSILDRHMPMVYRAQMVHDSATVDGLGGVTRPAEYPPLNLGIVA
jgi:hypothetical protein